MKAGLVIGLAIAGAAGVAGASAGVLHSVVPMPPNARLLTTEDPKLYLSPFCVADAQTRASGGRYGFTTAAQAEKLGYKPDQKCLDADGFTEAVPIWSHAKRWNKDGSWNW